MKTTVALVSTLALAVSSTQAALTTQNVTYDIFAVQVFEIYGTLAEVVLAKDDPWLTTTFDSVITDVEAQLALGQETYPYYNGRFAEFLDNAVDYDDRFEALPDEYEAWDLPVSSLLGYAARPYVDAVFDAVESTLSTLKNTTLSEWHMAQRQVMEKRVLNGTSTGLLAGKINEYLLELAENEAAWNGFDTAASELFERAQDEYEIPSDGNDDAEDDAEDAQ